MFFRIFDNTIIFRDEIYVRNFKIGGKLDDCVNISIKYENNTPNIICVYDIVSQMTDEYTKYENQIKTRYSTNTKLNKIIKKNEEYVKTLINNQLTKHEELEKLGFFGNHETTQISELKYCIDYLLHGLDIDIIEEKCKTNPVLNQLRESLYCSIFSVTADPLNNYLYGPTIRVIMKIIDFYDIFIRSIKEVPPYYHKYRYEHFVEYCISLAKDGLFIFPAFANIGATDLLKLRPYPIFPIGVSITLNYVDEYFQTPVEFFIHDINHVRRMFETNISDMKRRKIDINDFVEKKKYYAESKICLDEVLYILNNTLENRPTRTSHVEQLTIPQITQNGEKKQKNILHLELDDYSTVNKNDPIDQGYAQLIKIILFEITHEDAMPMHKDVICSTILRNAGIETAFPRVDENGKLIIRFEKGGSILGFVKYKIRYGFFDSVKLPLEVVVKYFYRTDKQLGFATQLLLNKLCGTVIPIGSPEFDRIMINITDRSGLNLPVNDDVVRHYAPEVIDDPLYGDLTDDSINALRKKHGIADNLFTGDRPKPVTEQINFLTTLRTGIKGGTRKKQIKNYRINRRNKTMTKIDV